MYVALSDAECLRLAARHNIIGHFHCEMSHRDYVSIVHKQSFNVCMIFFCFMWDACLTLKLESCRLRLYVMYNKDVSTDATPPPNTEWKKSCSQCLFYLLIICTVPMHVYIMAKCKHDCHGFLL